MTYSQIYKFKDDVKYWSDERKIVVNEMFIESIKETKRCEFVIDRLENTKEEIVFTNDLDLLNGDLLKKVWMKNRKNGFKIISWEFTILKEIDGKSVIIDTLTRKFDIDLVNDHLECYMAHLYNLNEKESYNNNTSNLESLVTYSTIHSFLNNIEECKIAINEDFNSISSKVNNNMKKMCEEIMFGDCDLVKEIKHNVEYESSTELIKRVYCSLKKDIRKLKYYIKIVNNYSNVKKKCDSIIHIEECDIYKIDLSLDYELEFLFEKTKNWTNLISKRLELIIKNKDIKKIHIYDLFEIISIYRSFDNKLKVFFYTKDLANYDFKKSINIMNYICSKIDICNVDEKTDIIVTHDSNNYENDSLEGLDKFFEIEFIEMLEAFDLSYQMLNESYTHHVHRSMCGFIISKSCPESITLLCEKLNGWKKLT